MKKNLERLSYLLSGSNGKTKAHGFIHECGVRQLTIHNINRFLLGDSVRYFLPIASDTDKSRIIMFSDNSGIELVLEDVKFVNLTATFLHSDISEWVNNYNEIDSLELV